MHPNPAFEWTDVEQMLTFVSETAFAHIFTATDAGLFVVHAPVIVKNGRIWFHVSKRNRIADQLEDRQLLISVSGRQGYHSANWYASEDQVPTWHYEAVEIEGKARTLSHAELVELLDRLSDTMEQRYSAGRPWKREKMGPGKFEAMTNAIIGFEVDPTAIRGTRKFNQHKRADDLAATLEGQRCAGGQDIVRAIQELTAQK